MGRGYFDGWAPYVPVAQRRRQAERKAAALKKQGQVCQPVAVAGRAIARSFWGKAWCDNLEAYSDYANRLPRGRTYVRNGSVIDLCVDGGKVRALVSGSDLYRVEISVQALEPATWKAIVEDCTGKVASLIEILQGRLSKEVMAVVTRPGAGLFPMPRQLRFSCSCPDGAAMCKHVAATLYGVGSRLDDAPQLLFHLRQVEPQELIQHLGDLPAAAAPDAHDALANADLSALFGIDLGEAPQPMSAPAEPPKLPPKLPPKAPARKAKKAQPAPRKIDLSITASELIARGVPRHMISSWLVSGVLLRTPTRGKYLKTPKTEGQIKACLARYGQNR